jgi:hypothetical protein
VTLHCAADDYVIGLIAVSLLAYDVGVQYGSMSILLIIIISVVNL